MWKKTDEGYASGWKSWDCNGCKYVSKFRIVKYDRKWWLQEHISDGNYSDEAPFDTLLDAKTAAGLLWDRLPKIPTDFDKAMQSGK